MAETAHIAAMAEKLSDELFAEFFWEKVGPTNQNWTCDFPDDHGVKKHPSDVVFYYDEPYSQSRTYVQCDLKSYAKDSISKSAIHGAIESLAKQVTCAEISEEWQSLYMHQHVTAEICGLLFVYNHDGGYDKEFNNVVNSVKNENLKLPKHGKIVVLGPEDIYWLDNVRFEIRMLRSSENTDRLPSRDKCEYYYPQLVRKANLQMTKAKAATVEMLTAPWIILRYKIEEGDKDWGVIVFYRRSGAKEEEFMYLVDYLRHYQVINQGTVVRIKALNSDSSAHAVFQKAVQRYIEEIEGISADESVSTLSELVKNIKFSKMTQVVSNFSEIELGMDYE